MLGTLIPHWFGLAVVTCLGAILGSFLNCFIYRWPRRISILKRARSFCPRCKAQLTWYDNIPLLSWISLGGRCRTCKQSISWVYPVVELLTAGLFALAYYTVIMVNEADISVAYLAIIHALITSLIAEAFVDCQVHRIPDEITKPGIVLALLLSVLVPELHRFQPAAFRLFDPAVGVPHRLDSFIASLQWAVLSGGILYALGVLWLAIRGVEAMGFGDVKLMAMVGGLLGHYGFVAILVAASVGTFLFLVVGSLIQLVRLIVTRREKGTRFSLRLRIAFGPLLALGTGLMIFWGPLMIAGYLKLIHYPPPVMLDYVCPLIDRAYF